MLPVDEVVEAVRHAEDYGGYGLACYNDFNRDR